jgi:CRISPR-associated protein Cas5t
MLCLYVEAPFAVCRTFTAGWYRPTASFLTPSAAYGLLLNLAGIESRLREEEPDHDGKTPASLMRAGLPQVRLALGAPAFRLEGQREVVVAPEHRFPHIQTIYQQLHNYPVGTSGQGRAESAKGNKYNITPVRREFLTGLRAFVCVDGNLELESRVTQGLNGQLNQGRYGLPFLGDNQFLVDRLEVFPEPRPAHWYEQITERSEGPPRPRTTRLTIWIDRADLSKTKSALYAPVEEMEPSAQIPDGAWTVIEPRAAEEPPAPKSKRSKG